MTSRESGARGVAQYEACCASIGMPKQAIAQVAVDGVMLINPVACAIPALDARGCITAHPTRARTPPLVSAANSAGIGAGTGQVGGCPDPQSMHRVAGPRSGRGNGTDPDC